MNEAVKQTLLAPVYDVSTITPLQQAARLSGQYGNDIYLKREDLQPIHSFKIRGAYNKMVHLTAEERRNGVIAASAGNHAQGVALSARKLGIPATIVMPQTTPEIKVRAVKDYGADVILAGDNYSEAYEACRDVMASSGQTLIHPFDDEMVIAGQGTVGREILEQLPDVDYIFIPVGGGGLIAGIAQYIKALRPDVRIIGVEPDDSNAMQASLQAGERLTLPHVGVFADGVAVKQVGSLTYDICKRYVDDIVTIDNDAICAAIKQIFEETRSIVEPAGALSLAGATAYLNSHGLRHKKIVTICSGANMSFEKLQFIAERTLLGSGREALFAVELSERPGALTDLCAKIVGKHNITAFSYRLKSRESATIFIGINLASETDRTKLMQALRANGYKFTDYSSDDVVKEHVRHMIGGTTSAATNEHIYLVNFPERPGALADFLQRSGKQFNISLFHYRGQGGDVGSVMIGFEASEARQLETAIAATGYDHTPVKSAALRSFL